MKFVKATIGVATVSIVACAPHISSGSAPSEQMVMATGMVGTTESVHTSPLSTAKSPTPQMSSSPSVEVDRHYTGNATVKAVSILFAEDGVVAFSVKSEQGLPHDGIKIVVQFPGQNSTPSIYQRQTDQYGQFERWDGDVVGDGSRFVVTVKSTGDFIAEAVERGVEDTIPSIPVIEDGFTRFPQEEVERDVQALSEIVPLKKGMCGAQHGQKLRFYDSNKRWHLEFGGESPYKYTLDTSFPNKPIVVMSHGGGSEFRTARYHRFANYTQHVRTDISAATVRKNIARFVPHGWITRDGPIRAASIYQEDIRACIDPGTPVIELVHSLGGYKAATAHVSGGATLHDQSLGIIALGTPWGGTHLGLLEAIQEEMSHDYEAEKLYGITTGLLLDYGAIDASYSSRPFVEMLVGKSFSVLNEGWRSSTFSGRWTGIPTKTYKWYSGYFPREGRYLSALLSQNKRLTSPCFRNEYAETPAIVSFGNVEKDPPSGSSPCVYNFAEGLLSELDRTARNYTGFRRQPVDIIAGYYSGDDIPEKREAFLARFRGIRHVITLVSTLIQTEKEKFEEEALPFTASILGRMASVDSRRPNANALSDGISLLEGPLKTGESILVPGSAFKDLKVDETRYQERKPDWARKMVALKNVNHALLAIGDLEGRVFGYVDQFILERLEPLREEERITVFTQKDRSFLEGAFFAYAAEKTCDYQTGVCTPHYGVMITNVVHDPDGRGEMNRVRLTLQNTSGWKYGYGMIVLDMVKRLSNWFVLVPSSPSQPSTN